MSQTKAKPSLWQRIKAIGHTIGDFQARLILTLLYAIFIVPVGAAMRFSEDVLQQRSRPINGSYWQQKRAIDQDLHNARRQS
ncbi:MAG: hypothetical protein U0175_11795 [Caldilineaceae bacterium]